MTKVTVLRRAIVAGAMSMTTMAAADSFEPADAALVEGVAIIPTMTLREQYDDNVLNAEADQVDSLVTVLRPAVKVGVGDDISRLGVQYLLEAARYHQSREDDYVDHQLTLGGKHEFTARHRLAAGYTFAHGHEERGTGLSEGQGDAFSSPIEYDQQRADLTYGFGVRQAVFNIDAKLNYSDLAYTNFSETTRYRDRDAWRYGLVGYWNLSGRTSLLLDVSQENVRYDTLSAAGNTQDSDVLRAKTGVRWEITGKTSGTARVGWQSKNFDDGQRADFRGFSWDIGAQWSPRSYSTVKLEGGREARDPDTDGDYIKETTLDLSWRHAWLDRFATTLGAGYEGRDYTGVDRSDDLYVLQLAADYAFSRWARVAFGYELRDQQSSQAAIEYDKDLVYVLLEVGL